MDENLVMLDLCMKLDYMKHLVENYSSLKKDMDKMKMLCCTKYKPGSLVIGIINKKHANDLYEELSILPINIKIDKPYIRNNPNMEYVFSIDEVEFFQSDDSKISEFGIEFVILEKMN